MKNIIIAYFLSPTLSTVQSKGSLEAQGMAQYYLLSGRYLQLTTFLQLFTKNWILNQAFFKLLIGHNKILIVF